ncbi:MAG: beta-lactam-binding protein with PASTA domain [Saprospiraceae bacterium]|jgi:beta-lactam-binding protein with PASTA domain
MSYGRDIQLDIMKEFFRFLISKPFLKQLLYVFIFLAVVLMLVLLWLRFYTNHGQKLELPDYINQEIEDARKDAEDKTFEIIITDSIHKVGKPGGLIIDQNPTPGSMVKEKRKIYVNVTKFSPDQIKVGDLPILYGSEYDQKRTELKYLDITSKIKSEKFDRGEPNHILEVWYKGKLIINGKILKSNLKIDKGGKLEFVISKPEGGRDLIPDLVCQEFIAAESKCMLSKFQIGTVTELGEITDRSTAFVVDQRPSFDGSSLISHNSAIAVTIIQERPDECK